MVNGGLGPPIRYLFGLAPTAAEPGGVTFTMPLPDGSEDDQERP